MKQSQISNTGLKRYVGVVLLLSLCMPTFAQVQDSVRVRAENSVAGAASLYTVYFTPADTLAPDAEFEIDFPAGFDLSKVAIAGSESINGGFDVQVDGQKVRVKRKGRGAVKMPGESLDIMFATVSNPAAANSIYKIEVNIKNSRGAAQRKSLSGSILISDKKVEE